MQQSGARITAGGTKLGWLTSRRAAGRRACSTLTALSGVIVSHDHGDMTATVQAGTPLAALPKGGRRAGGQRLAIDPPLGPHARSDRRRHILGRTMPGPRRIMAYGSLRELCIGASFVLADGTEAKSGSKVIKNVAGYDLCKLLCGARGTLAVVTQLTVRLHPISAVEHTLRSNLGFTGAASVAAQLAALEPEAVTYHDDGQNQGLWVRLTGSAGFVRTHAVKAQSLIEAAGGGSLEALEAAASPQAWADVTEQRRSRPGETTVAITIPTRSFAAWSADYATWAAEQPTRPRVVADPLLGFALIHIRPGPSAEAHAECVRALRRSAADHAGHARLRDRARGVLELVDPYGPLPDSVPLMNRVKAALDPDGRLAPNHYFTTP